MPAVVAYAVDQGPQMGEAADSTVPVCGMDVVQEGEGVAGLDVSFDQWGNLFGRTPSFGDDQCVMSGSHLDSVFNGGNYDGPLGVLSALEAVRLILEKGVTIQKPLEVVSFIEEEGSRFIGLFGSQLAAHALGEAEISQITDAQGNRFLDELQKVSFPYPANDKDLAKRVETFIELHIEQGKRLERAGVPIGPVTSIAGPYWRRITFTGQADHAGATDYIDRRDALLAAAEFIQAVREIGTSEFIDTSRMTVGKLQVEPNVTNIVANRVMLDVDNRNANAEARLAAEKRLNEALAAICAKHQITYDIRTISDVAAEIVPERVQNTIIDASRAANVGYKPLVSWAAHDTMIMARCCEVGMIFVPCRDGRSHSPEEYTKPEDIAAGVAVLANTLAALAN